MKNQSVTSSHLDKQAVTYGFVAGWLAGSAITALLMTYSIPTQDRGLQPANPVPKAVAIPRIALSSRIEQNYIERMIPHHEQAVVMAELALSRATHPEIKTLAAAIKQTQTQEIQQMQTWYQKWYGTKAPTYFSRWWHRNLPGDEPEQYRTHVMDTDLAALKNAPDFDREFMRQMISHNQMEIMMSSMVLDSAEHTELRDFAQSAIENQRAEIGQMQQWYQTWYAEQPN